MTPGDIFLLVAVGALAASVAAFTVVVMLARGDEARRKRK